MIIHAADSSSPAAARALILGLADTQNSSKPRYFLHISGTSSLGDRPITKRILESRVFSDKDDIYGYLKEREAGESYAQRATDIKTVQVGEQAGIGTLVVKAPLIYGRGTGLFNQQSFHIPALSHGAVAAGQAEYVGDGAGVWDYVHVVDLAGLFELLVGRILRGEPVSTGRQGFYFAETQRHSWKHLAEGIAKAGHSLGRLTSPVPQSITLKEASERYTGGDEHVAEVGLAPNSFTSAQRARELGWKPSVGIELQQTVQDDFTLLFGCAQSGRYQRNTHCIDLAAPFWSIRGVTLGLLVRTQNRSDTSVAGTMAVRFRISRRGDVCVESPEGKQEVLEFLEHAMGAHYIFLERIGNRSEKKEYKVVCLVFKDQNYLFFVRGTFLISLHQRGVLNDREEMLRVVNLHASLLVGKDRSALYENWVCANEALASTYFVMNRAAMRWGECTYDDAKIKREIRWLHIIDEFIDSLIGRHNDGPLGVEIHLRTRHKTFLQTLKTEYGIATDEIPPKKPTVAVLKVNQFDEALHRYKMDDLAG
ncbi:NAD(P)-binding protein [Aspergillus affinis]|uniref:NAD(P)-binding protein n=1 Tax=Aspergillus affinis TaxID=1070780 RepID=UPI0022FE0BB7|nr:NAD(P)-binding protein [Aspergillus affinis]KAI9035508.1 NAD(P)-binding protein [Aspergillus affinis]